MRLTLDAKIRRILESPLRAAFVRIIDAFYHLLNRTKD
jgi:hypothetical protein